MLYYHDAFWELDLVVNIIYQSGKHNLPNTLMLVLVFMTCYYGNFVVAVTAWLNFSWVDIIWHVVLHV